MIHEDLIFQLIEYLSIDDLFHFMLMNLYWLNQLKDLYYGKVTKFYSKKLKFTKPWIKNLTIIPLDMKIKQNHCWGKRYKKICMYPIEIDLHPFLHLNRLEFGDNFDQPLPFLPETLQVIIFGRKYNHPIYSLPLNLKALLFPASSKFNHVLPSMHHLVHLKLGFMYSHSIIFPETLKILDIHSSYYPTIHYLPFGLEELSIKPQIKIDCQTYAKVSYYFF